MRIGILTLPLHNNYGGILQAYALVRALENMGHEVYLIDTRFKKKTTFLKSLKATIKQLVKPNPNKKKVDFSQEIRDKTFKLYIKQFIDNQFKHITEPFVNPSTMGKEIKKYKLNAVIVGSDQIWNPKYYKHIEIAYCSFLDDKNVLKISYAPSFGVDTWKYSPEQEKVCKDLIQKFDAVSVRENTGAELCEKHFDIKATWVLDPTMLLATKEYMQLIPKSSNLQTGKLFTYVLDKNEDKNMIISHVMKIKNLQEVELETIEGYGDIPLEWGTKSTVENWIRNFNEADFVVTDSFHGTVFSILFNKPFFSVINFKRGATRFHSLLNHLGLEDRLLGSFSDLSNEKIEKDINWSEVNHKLEIFKEESLDFLSNSLQ